MTYFRSLRRSWWIRSSEAGQLVGWQRVYSGRFVRRYQKFR